MTPQRSPICLRCFAKVPTGRVAYCSDVCQQRESHARWFAAHPGYKARKDRERRKRQHNSINARRRELYRQRAAEEVRRG